MHKLFLFLTLIACAAGCTSKDKDETAAGFKLDVPFLLKQGQTIAWENNNAVRVHFNQVLDDSRCPVDVVCITAGWTVSEMLFEQPTPQTDTVVWGVTLNGKTDSATFGDFTVRVLRVLPDALSNVQIPQEQYELELVVRKQ